MKINHEQTPRWISAAIILIALSVFINYVDRGSLDCCPILKDEFHISVTQLGILLTSSLVTYAFANFVIGSLAERKKLDRIGAFP